jgi:hypothetical protein
MGGFSTAVMPPTNRGFDIQPPDPFANLKALAMQGQIAQQKQTLATGQQEMQVRAQQMQLVDQQIKDQQAIAQALRDWDPSQPATAMMKTAADNGASGNAIATIQQHFADMRLKNAQADEAGLKAQQIRHDQFRAQGQAIIEAKPEFKQDFYAQYLPKMQKELDPGETLPAQYPGDDWMAGQVKGHALTGQLAEEELKRRTAEKEEAQAKEATQKANIEADLFQREQFARQHPEDANAQQAALTAEQRVEAANKKAELEKQTAALQEVIAQHKAENTLRDRQINIESAKNVREQAIYEQTYGSGANEALMGVEPGLRKPAVADAQKAADEYNKSVGASRDIATLISEARAGNKAAYANIPIEGVLQITTSRGTTRINRNELEAYAGAGSLYDKIAGKLGKWTAGASIPSDVMNDLEQMHNAFGANASKNYDAKLASINQNYKSHFKSVAQAPESPQTAGKYKAGDSRVVNGTTYTRNEQGQWLPQPSR